MLAVSHAEVQTSSISTQLTLSGLKIIVAVVVVVVAVAVEMVSVAVVLVVAAAAAVALLLVRVVVLVGVVVEVVVMVIAVVTGVSVTAEVHFQKADCPDADPACDETPCWQHSAILEPQQASYGVDTSPSPQVLSDP